ncbi:hypothetical protein O6H91_07G129800 [Diphasiastrum complanatum]|uniref:Uncharacterized protein n=1 Tax=Diphasiastrum complanatum TaxID=34168 RepID=A0ACC2D9M9_DIPCM|nr:hypothetical protein O6H91_07G129800 [Diphasiastrum complanatum]
MTSCSPRMKMIRWRKLVHICQLSIFRSCGTQVMRSWDSFSRKGGKKLKVAEDQQLMRGNDRLKSSYKIHVPVRLIRGFKVTSRCCDERFSTFQRWNVF